MTNQTITPRTVLATHANPSLFCSSVATGWSPFPDGPHKDVALWRDEVESAMSAISGLYHLGGRAVERRAARRAQQGRESQVVDADRDLHHPVTMRRRSRVEVGLIAGTQEL